MRSLDGVIRGTFRQLLTALDLHLESRHAPHWLLGWGTPCAHGDVLVGTREQSWFQRALGALVVSDSARRDRGRCSDYLADHSKPQPYAISRTHRVSAIEPSLGPTGCGDASQQIDAAGNLNRWPLRSSVVARHRLRRYCVGSREFGDLRDQGHVHCVALPSCRRGGCRLDRRFAAWRPDWAKWCDATWRAA